MLTKLFNILRDTFSYVVVDTSGGFDSKALTALENSDLIFFVTIVNLPAVRNCQRCLELFAKLGFYKSKIFRNNAKTLDLNEDLPYYAN